MLVFGMAVNQLVQVRIVKLYTVSISCVFFSPATLATCSDLTAPTNGMIAYDMESMNARPLNTVATYTCITGYMVTGDMTRTCGAGGVWSGTDPTCECDSIQWIVNVTLYYYFVAVPACPDLTLPANGGITYNPTTTPRADGSTATYTCTTGYQVTGLMVRMCSVSGWSTGDDPVCTGEGDECICADSVLIVRPPTAICPDLILSNGMISFDPATSIILEGTVATHSCDTGYQLSSSTTTRTCQSNRTWSGDDITCQRNSLVTCARSIWCLLTSFQLLTVVSSLTPPMEQWTHPLEPPS